MSEKLDIIEKKIEGILNALRITTQVIADLHINNTSKKQNICYFCNTPGHWIQKYPEIPTEFQEYCIRCWRRGHFSKKCKYKGKMPVSPWMNEQEYQLFLEKCLKNESQQNLPQED
ncbi:hypothetical protein RhiirA1_470856 [Rhizophagus irregularis]|uniref:CCHC-type domain-containing protein n=1 Tax=Rhizophagus irregularis TaxID=588596 RepID=A0A2N0R5D9_9GLOM|nr:hypothetical protein RhiirA1_470856 [Rhizophagus irregularis]